MKCSVSSLRIGSFLLSTLFVACTTTVYKESLPTNASGKYDTAFPFQNCAAQLAEINESVKLLGCIAYYRTYEFPLAEHVRPPHVNAGLLSLKGRKPVFTNSTASGTATIISYDERRIVLMTCAHVVAFPDTVFKYYIDENRHATPFLKSCAIKDRQTNHVAVLPEGGELEILAMDKNRDIALLGCRFTTDSPFPVPVFRYPLGTAGDLDWGSFVYVFGYPSGYKMVTRGIVSNPNKDRFKTFYVDAVMSRGFSGGLALAVRNGAPNFELVGMMKLVSGRTQRSLVPPPTDEELEYDPTVPYHGDIYVERESNIQYGVAQAISIDVIRDFVKEHRSELQEKGYQLPARWLAG